MGIEQELEVATSSTKQLISQIEQAYGSAIDISDANGAVNRARSVLDNNEEPAMQHAWVEVTVAYASLSAQVHAHCKGMSVMQGVGRDIIDKRMDASIASMRTALRQIVANPQVLGALPEYGIEADAVTALAGTAVEVAANDVDSAAAWIYRCWDHLLAAAKDKANAKASASAKNSSGGSQKHKL
ncbi:TPA: hypothetical protein ACGCG5_001585 [Stenotrophomonas maltophilia]